MIDLGTTSHIIVATLLAVGQLIEPIPNDVVERKTLEYKNSSSCADFKKSAREFEKNKCERIRKNKRKFKEVCAAVEIEKNELEVKCATNLVEPKVLAFKPKPLDSYYAMSNLELVEDLNLICSAVQDRAFLEREQWLSGEVSNRDDLASKMVAFSKPEIQDLAASILLEAQSGDLKVSVANQVLLALCHWKVDRTEVAKRIDFKSGLSYLTELREELPSLDKLPEMKQANFILNKEGRLIGEVYDKDYITRGGQKLLKKSHRRRSVSAGDIPDMVFDAFSAVEDKRFKTHNGFDFEALKRLYYSSAQGSKQGGSTFTMQIIKNAFFSDDVETERSTGLRTLRRKLKEILTIPLVETKYSKKEILTYYLNLIDFLPRSQGIQMASIDLFGKKDLFTLELEEIAMLAALPKGSSLYNPRRHPERAKLRRDTVLRLMMEQELISEAQKEEAQAKPLKLYDESLSNQDKIQARQYTAHLINSFSKMKKENSSDERWAMGGLDVITPLDSKLQKTVNEAVRNGMLNYEKSRGRYQYTKWSDESGQNVNVSELVEQFEGDWARAVSSKVSAHPYPETGWLVAAKISDTNQSWGLADGKKLEVSNGDKSFYRSLSLYDLVLLSPEKDKLGEATDYRVASGSRAQAAAVVIDVKSGEILALNGGFTAGPYGKFAANNRATRSLRQPGSTVKPFTYMYALNKGIQPNALLGNSSVTFPQIPGCGYNWNPSNAGGGGSGSLTMVKALESSVNRSFMNLFLNLTGIDYNKRSSNNFSNASPFEVSSIDRTLTDLYDFASSLGAYPERSSLALNKRRQPCLPWLIGSYETTVLNMAQAYATLANGGLKRPAVFLNEVQKNKQPLLVDVSQQKKSEVDQYHFALKNGLVHVPEAFGVLKGLKPQAAVQVRAILEGVVERGTARRISKWAGRVAGKTGTTNDSKDAWFVGFNSSIAVVVWTGYDDLKTYPNLGDGAYGGTVALPIFEDIMEYYYKEHPEELEKGFADPEETPGVVAQLVNLSSGKVVQDYQGRKCGSTSGAEAVYFAKEFVDLDKKLTCEK